MTNSSVEGHAATAHRAKSRRMQKWGWLTGAALVFLMLSVIARVQWPGRTRLLTENIDPNYALWAAGVIMVVIPLASLIYLRLVDEHEERAALWGSTVGFIALAAGCLAWLPLAVANLVPVMSLLLVVLTSALVGGVAQIWLQFR